MIPVYRPYPFREPVDPSVQEDLRRLEVKFETEAGAHVRGVVTLLASKVNGEFMDKVPSARIIAVVAVGYDSVDVQEATRRGIMITNTPEVLTDATADVTWALILATARRVVELDRFVREGKFIRWDWEAFRGLEVAGRTLGIVGAGRIGQAVGRRGKGFGMDLVYASRGRKPSFEDECGARPVDLPELLRQSDFVSINVPLSPETRHLIGARELALMKPTAILVNTARGPIVDEGALAAALEAGKIGGAGLDVYEHEPKVHPALLKLDNVVLLPHIGSATHETRAKMYNTALRNLVAALRGQVPPNCVNRQELGLK